MCALRAALVLGLCLVYSVGPRAGTISLPADVSVSLTAEPNSNLQSGQRIEFTISVTNHGPEPVTLVDVLSSPIYDELDINTATADCGNTLGLIVVDLSDGFYYVYDWDPTLELTPLMVGETRTCHLNLAFTQWAPDTFSLTFSMPYWLIDLDSSNNSATVTLRRAGQGTATPVPTVSPLSLAVLSALLALLAAVRRRKCINSA
jgi:uncharacterized protein DUF11/exosortase sorting signal-containing protein